MNVTALTERDALKLIEHLVARHGCTADRLVDEAGVVVRLPNGKQFVISRVAWRMARDEQQLETHFNYMVAKCTSK